MPSPKKSASPPPVLRPKTGSFLVLLVLAALGQAFLSQSDKPWTLWVGLLFFAGALWQWRKFPFPSARPQTPSGSTPSEIFIFSLILGLGFFFRVFRIDSLPAGMHTDQGLIGLSALRILHEGWRPFLEPLNYQVPEPLLFYQLAGWFGLAGSSSFTFHLFFILLSLFSFPLVFLAFRQLAGPRVALLSLFLLAVMRWNWIETRNGYPSLQVPLYFFGFLALWIYGLRARKNGPLYLSALVAGIGLYTYQAFKVVPFLILVYFLYEKAARWNQSKTRPKLWVGALILLATASPLLYYYGKNQTLGNRERDAFIGTQVLREQSWKPLLRVWTGTALMFNREGDPNPRHNIPGRRMLDDATGVLFVLGLALAWRARKEREGFYPLAGFVALSLPGLLSTDIAHSNRLVSLTPFVAYFAAIAAVSLYDKARDLWKDNPRLPAQAFLLLAAILSQNVYVYFVQQAGDPRCREAFGPAQNFIGQTLERLEREKPGSRYYSITPAYRENLTLSFLGYPARERILEFSFSGLATGKFPDDRTLVFFLEGEKAGGAEWLRQIFPGGRPEAFKDSQGRTLLWEYEAGAETLKKFHGWDRGLKGVYAASASWASAPLAVRRDPLLNLTGRRDFPFSQPPPFRVRWSGTLEIKQTGNYEFQFLASDQAGLWLDGRRVALEKPLALTPGPHPLRINFGKDSGNDLALTFIWKKPGETPWEVVPAEAFGKAPR